MAEDQGAYGKSIGARNSLGGRNSLSGGKNAFAGAGSYYESLSSAATRLSGDENRGIALLGQRIDRFIRYHRLRLKQVYDGLDLRRAQAFSAIPYLLHVNQQELPGYYERAGQVHGVAHFEFNAAFRNGIESLFRLQVPDLKDIGFRPVIRSVFVATNAGTLLQRNNDSVTFFLVVDLRSMGETLRAQLRVRTDAIASWAHEMGLAAHFIMVDPIWSSKGDFGSLTNEPARGALVLERFYRTAVYLAGEVPIFWCTSPGADADRHEKTARMTSRVNFDSALSFIDLGRVQLPPVKVRRRAMLALLNHDADSPMMLLVDLILLIYGANASTALCEHLKNRIYRGSDIAQFLDPYAMLFDAVCVALSHHGQWDKLKFFKRMVLIKLALVGMSRKRSKWAVIEELKNFEAFIHRWGWEQDVLDTATDVAEWPKDGVEQFDAELKSFVLSLYRSLSDSSRENPGRFDEEEVALLGRRLIASFTHRRGKVSHHFTYMLHELRVEDRFVFLDRLDEESKDRWSIYRKVVRREPAEGTLPMWTGRSIAQGATWAVLNGLLHQRTDVRIASSDALVTSAVVQELLGHLQTMLTGVDPLALATFRFAVPRCVRRGLFVLNFETKRSDEEAKAKERRHYLPSNWDVLNYGRNQESQVAEVCVITVDTWDEVFCHRLRGEDGLRKAIKLVFDGMAVTAQMEGKPEVLVPDGRSQRAIQDRVLQLLSAIDETVGSTNGTGEDRLFAYEVGGKFQVVRSSPEKVRVFNAKTLKGIVRLLTRFDERQQVIKLDALSPTLADIRGLTEKLQVDSNLEVCLGWRKNAQSSHIVVCEAGGNIYLREVDSHNLDEQMARILRRILHVIKQRIRDMRTLRKVLRVFELRDGQVQGDESHLYEDTVRVFRILGEPRKRHPEVFLRGQLQGGRDAIYLEYDGRSFEPRSLGRRFVTLMVKKMLENRKKYAQFDLFIEASTIEQSLEHPESRPVSLVEHLRLTDLYERLMARALRTLSGRPEKVMLSANSFSKGAE